MSSETFHEAADLLSPATQDMHRALVSLGEELEAVDWYAQRAEACTDDDLRAVLVHNKNEEIEHAMMVLEWIRRRSPVFDENIRTYSRTTGPITSIEKGATPGAPGGGSQPSGGSLGIGSLKGAR